MNIGSNSPFINNLDAHLLKGMVLVNLNSNPFNVWGVLIGQG